MATRAPTGNVLDLLTSERFLRLGLFAGRPPGSRLCLLTPNSVPHPGRPHLP
jgi:hypothetical protein